MASSLSAFLSSTRAVCLHSATTVTPVPITFTLVLGNPSADLDSFISAVVYAYFYSAQKQNPRRLFIPLLNLPTTSSRDLWRIRPEFGTALKLAQQPILEHDISNTPKDDNIKVLLEQLVTIADIRSARRSTSVSLFSDLPSQSSTPTSKKNDYVLVDHNVLSIPTLPMEDLNRHVNVTGCIDHHIDESFVPSDACPRIIKTGIGSCTSLIVQHLRDLQLWPSSDDEYATGELARLALAPILIDTANLTAEGKVSETDRDAVAFLESCIQSNPPSRSAQQDWNRDSFYDAIATTKANSLDLLTFSAIFERDYKEWTESTRDGEELNIGVSSIVKPITWLLEKAESVDDFLNHVHVFTHNSKRELALFGIMTTSTSASGEFQRELFVAASGTTASKALKDFEAKATMQLELKPWNTNSELLESMELRTSDTDRSSCLWQQQNVAKSRKEVAPLLRDSVKEC